MSGWVVGALFLIGIALLAFLKAEQARLRNMWRIEELARVTARRPSFETEESELRDCRFAGSELPASR